MMLQGHPSGLSPGAHLNTAHRRVCTGRWWAWTDRWASTAAPRRHSSTIGHGPRSTLPALQLLQAQKQGQLFSNLTPSGKPQPGSVIGSALLVAGTTIGAGILAVPAVTEPAGFSASAVALVFCCGYAIITGLLFAEVTLNTMTSQGAGNVSIVSMVRSTLGTSWVGAASALYIFQHYSLLVAYITRAGEILSTTSNLPVVATASAFAVGVGATCYGLNNKQLDAVNGVLVAGIVASFVGLVGLVLPSVDWPVLSRANWAAVPDTLPVLSLAFVYQNVVPVIAKDLEGNVDKIRLSLFLGCLLPLLMFVAWEAACLGAWDTLSHAPTIITDAATQEEVLQRASAPVVDPVKALSNLTSGVGTLVNSFSLLAIATSYIGFCLGLSDFLSDALQLKGGSRSGAAQGLEERTASDTGLMQLLRSDEELSRAATYVMVVLPPLLLSLTFPGLFFAALDIAGTYGVMTLFGILPAAMAWAQRSQISTSTDPSSTQLPQPDASPAYAVSTGQERQPVVMVPGGAPVLTGIAGFAVAVIAYELLQAVGVLV